MMRATHFGPQSTAGAGTRLPIVIDPAANVPASTSTRFNEVVMTERWRQRTLDRLSAG
jgi:hypothetical protein